MLGRNQRLDPGGRAQGCAYDRGSTWVSAFLVNRWQSHTGWLVGVLDARDRDGWHGPCHPGQTLGYLADLDLGRSRPRLKRSAPMPSSGGTPIALSTGERSTDPE